MSALGDALRAAGLQVTEYGDPGRPYAWTPSGVLIHHTAGPATGDAPSLNYLRSGSSSLPPPVVQLLIARSGQVHLISEGRANHAGTGSGLTAYGIPKDQGNQHLWGIEVESTGTAQDWPQVQADAAHTAARVLLQRMGKGSDRLWRHKDYAPGRKIDTLYDLAWHRAGVDGVTIPAPPPTSPPPTTPAPPPAASPWASGDVYLSKLKYGQKDSDSVRRLQYVLNAHPLANGSTLPVTGNYLDQTDHEVRLDQTQHIPPADPVKKSYVGPKQADHLFGGKPYTVKP